MPKFSVGESFTVAIFSGIEKVRMREGGVSRISVENCLSHTADNFRSGDPFSISLVSGIEKFSASEGYVTIFDFLSKFFCLTVPNEFVGEPCSVFFNFGYRKLLDKRRRSINNFRRKLFCLTLPTISVVGIPSVFP